MPDPDWYTRALAEGRILSEVGANAGALGGNVSRRTPPHREADANWKHRGWASFDLPYPPTINTYWRHVGAKVLISGKGRRYRKAVVAAMRLLFVDELVGPLKLTATFHPPDNRRRDLDNLPKALLDALKHAGLYADDSQIRHMDIRFGPVVPGGRAAVCFTKIEEEGK